MSDPIGMLESLTKWGQLIEQLDVAAKEEGIEPGSYLGSYHQGVMRLFRGVESVERARCEEMRELSEQARAAAEANAAQARTELEKLDRVTRQMEAALRRQELAHEEAEGRVIKRVAEQVGKQVGEAAVIRAKAYSRTQFMKTVAAGVAAALLLLAIGAGLDRVSLAPGPATSELDGD